MERVAQGGAVTLTAVFQNGTNDLVDPVSPTVDVIDPDGLTIVLDDVPTRLSLGNYSYTWTVPVDAALGLWRIHWTGVVDGLEAGGDDFFEVVAPGRAVSISQLIDLTRLTLGDTGEAFVAQVVGDGQATRFELPHELVETDPAKLVVSIPGQTLTQNQTSALSASEYSINGDTGTLTLGEALPEGQTLQVSGTHYFKRSATDLQVFIDTAFTMHTYGRAGVTYDNLPQVEYYALALRAAIEALWAELAEQADQIDVVTPEGMSIPEGQRYQQLLNLITALEAEYRDIAAALNIGLWRIQMFNLRRISRTTGRLVPVYTAREYDDTTAPTRVYPPIDPGN